MAHDRAAADDEQLTILRQHVASLYEHFDTVQIFVTRYDETDGGTFNFTHGAGNWFARLGQVHAFAAGADADAADAARPDHRDGDA